MHFDNWGLEGCSYCAVYAGIAMHRSLTAFGMTTMRRSVIPSGARELYDPIAAYTPIYWGLWGMFVLRNVC